MYLIKLINLDTLDYVMYSFVNISYFGVKFLQYTLIYYTFKICKKNRFLKPEHETTSLR